MLLTKFFIFGMLGIFAHVLYSSIKEVITKRNWSLEGETSLWMLPIYGLIVFIYPYVHYKVNSFGVVIRGLTYMLVIFAVQFLTGWLLGKINACPWNYKSKLSLGKGLIDLVYAPVWFVAGLLIEFIYPHVSQLANNI